MINKQRTVIRCLLLGIWCGLPSATTLVSAADTGINSFNSNSSQPPAPQSNVTQYSGQASGQQPPPPSPVSNQVSGQPPAPGQISGQYC